MPFLFSPASAGDLDPIVAAMLLTFYAGPSAYSEVKWGPDPQGARAVAKAHFLREFRSEPTVRWMKAVDAATGQLAAALQLKIYPNFVPTIIAPWELDVDHWEGAEREQAQQCWMELQGSVNEQIGRFGEGGEAHLRLSILFTNPAYQRQGAGRHLVQWGCQLADHLDLPIWVEASLIGKHLYAQCGFVEIARSHVKTEKWEIARDIMRRPARAERDL